MRASPWRTSAIVRASAAHASAKLSLSRCADRAACSSREHWSMSSRKATGGNHQPRGSSRLEAGREPPASSRASGARLDLSFFRPMGDPRRLPRSSFARLLLLATPCPPLLLAAREPPTMLLRLLLRRLRERPPERVLEAGARDGERKSSSGGGYDGCFGTGGSSQSSCASQWKTSASRTRSARSCGVRPVW